MNATAFTFQPLAGIEATSPNYPPIGALISAISWSSVATATMNSAIDLRARPRKNA
tara:strand:- start:264 stop:431 length:168 start_codon:yes stop_codon:yes gene_type:complete